MIPQEAPQETPHSLPRTRSAMIHQIQTRLGDGIESAVRPVSPLPGFAPRPAVSARPFTLPRALVDRCRQAYLGVATGDAPRTIGVTSAHSGEGRTSVAAGIATALAVDTEEPTLLVECDLENACFDELFGLNAGPGLTEWLDGTGDLRIVRMAPHPNAYVLCAGNNTGEPGRMFSRLQDSELTSLLNKEFANVVLDLPPVMGTSYAGLAARMANSVVFVARAGQTTVKDLVASVDALRPTEVAGFVLNGYAASVPRWLAWLL